MPWKRRWWKKWPKFKHFLFVLFWAHCHHMAFSLLHRKEWIWHQRSWAWQCQEVCLTVCKYLCMSTFPLLAHGVARCSLAFSLERLSVLEGAVVARWWLTCHTSPITHPPLSLPITAVSSSTGLTVIEHLQCVLLQDDWNTKFLFSFIFEHYVLLNGFIPS